jgi:hypothetical protein
MSTWNGFEIIASGEDDWPVSSAEIPAIWSQNLLCSIPYQVASTEISSMKLQVCVKRRAVLSVATNPNCSSKQEAEEAVDAVWAKCYKDTAPFDRIP